MVKLAVPETESAALWAFLERRPARATSVVTQVEARRSLRRAAAGPKAGARLEDLIRGLSWLELGGEIRRIAGLLQPTTLRSLDALHLASALALGEDLAGMVGYGVRLATARRAPGHTGLAPA